MSIHPPVRYTDPKAAMAFLTEALGFVQGPVPPADDGTVGHAELSFGDVWSVGSFRPTPARG